MPGGGADRSRAPPRGARHDVVVPDDLDYAWLGRLVDHTESWSAEDLAIARRLLADQGRALDDEHAKDVRGRRKKQEIVEELESAIARYGERRSR